MKLYMQASYASSGNNTREVLKIKEIFPNLQANKIENIQRIIKDNYKLKPKLNMIMKEPSRKQIIVPINNNNRIKFVAKLSVHISNINRVLKNIKLDVKADFICLEQADIIIVTNKVIFSLDLQTVENYIKNTNQIEADKVKSLCLLQLKFYFKIIRILYIMESIGTLLTSVMVKDIIKKNHIFNNIAIISRPKIIKILLRLVMAIIWLDIQNMQSRSKVKGLINRFLMLAVILL